MRPKPSEDGAGQEQQRRRGSSIPLGILGQPGHEQRVREQVAVDARQDHTGQAVVLQGATDDGLSAALERHQGQGDEHLPAQLVLGVRLRVDGDDGAGDDNQDELRGERGHQDPSFLGRKEPVEAGEEERPHAKERDRGE